MQMFMYHTGFYIRLVSPLPCIRLVSPLPAFLRLSYDCPYVCTSVCTLSVRLGLCRHSLCRIMLSTPRLRQCLPMMNRSLAFSSSSFTSPFFAISPIEILSMHALITGVRSAVSRQLRTPTRTWNGTGGRAILTTWSGCQAANRQCSGLEAV